MGKLRITLTGILFWGLMFTSVFLIQNANVLAGNAPLDDLSFYLLLGMVCTFLMFFYIAEHFVNKMKVDIILFIGSLTLLATGIAAIWLNKEVNTFTNYNGDLVTVIVSFQDKLRATIFLSVGIILVYTLCFPYTRRYFNSKKFLWFAYAFIVFTYATIVYSLVTELDYYKEILIDHHFGDYRIHSIYHFKNTYGFALLLGILSCVAVNIRRGRWWSYLTMIIFGIALVFPLCTTALLISTVLFVIYFFAESIRMIKRHPGWGTFFLVVVISVVIGVTTLYAVGGHSSNDILKTFTYYVNKFIFDKDFDTFTTRETVWAQTIALFKQSTTHLIIGRGYSLSGKFLFAESGVISTAHNAYLEIILRFGIVGLVLYVSLLGYFIYCLIRLIGKKQVKFGLYFGLIFLCIFAHSMMESSYVFDFTVDGMTMALVFYLPVVNMWKQYKHPKLRNYVLLTPVLKGGVKKIYAIRIATAAIVSILYTAVLMLTTRYTSIYPEIKELGLAVLVLGGVLLVFAPYIITLFYYRNSNKAFVHLCVWLTLLAAAITVLVSYLVWYFSSDQSYRVVMITAPCTLAGICVIYLAFLMPIYRSGFSEWFKNWLLGLIPYGLTGCVFMTLAGGIPLWILSNQHMLTPLSLCFVLCMGFMGFFLFFLLIPFKWNRVVVKDLNDSAMFNFKRASVNKEL